MCETPQHTELYTRITQNLRVSSWRRGNDEVHDEVHDQARPSRPGRTTSPAKSGTQQAGRPPPSAAPSPLSSSRNRFWARRQEWARVELTGGTQKRRAQRKHVPPSPGTEARTDGPSSTGFFRPMTAQAACVNAYHSLTPELKAMGCLCTTDHLEEMVAMQQDVARR